MAYKVFTNGSVLNASEVNDNLMNQAVITFTNSTARASAITSPVEGMVTYLADTDTYQFWNGSAWTNLVPPATSGLNLINTTTFTGVASVSLGSNASPIFTSTYDNYRIIIESDVSSNADRKWNLRLRTNTTDDSAAAYRIANQGINTSAGLVNDVAGSATSAIIMNNSHYQTNIGRVVLDLLAPFSTKGTVGIGMNQGQDGGGNTIHQSFTFNKSTATAYNGFTILNSVGNFVNGIVTVYGYGK